MVQPTAEQTAGETSPARKVWQDLSPRVRTRRTRKGRWATALQKPCSPKAMPETDLCEHHDADVGIDEAAQSRPSSPANSTATSTTEEDTMSSCPSSRSDVAELSSAEEVIVARPVKDVRFESDVSIHEVTPYSEIYGLHPREFDFDKDYSMLPAKGFGDVRQALAWEDDIGAEGDESSQSDSDDEDDDTWDEVYHSQSGCLIVE
mmetsp:Transcript_28650/g.52149  ORF Transcript_28650/g.52149 Transcript_28650/m.52149 type:complete len:205 (-) Transcript_28650:151-765(-)